MSDPVRIGIVSISDRASTGVYEDKGLPALKDWLTAALRNPIEFVPRLIPDDQAGISATFSSRTTELTMTFHRWSASSSRRASRKRSMFL